jgi:hypothetical protein
MGCGGAEPAPPSPQPLTSSAAARVPVAQPGAPATIGDRLARGDGSAADEKIREGDDAYLAGDFAGALGGYAAAAKLDRMETPE